MPETTYTMVAENGGTDEIVARGVTLPRALVLALEYGRRGRATIVHSDIGPFRYFAIGRRLADGNSFVCATFTIVQRSDNPGLDADHAMETFEQVLLRQPYEIWKGRVVADEDFARCDRNEESKT